MEHIAGEEKTVSFLPGLSVKGGTVVVASGSAWKDLLFLDAAWALHG